MLFFSYFKELVGKEVTVDLKNDLAIRGMLHSVDQYLNIKLENTMLSIKTSIPTWYAAALSAELLHQGLGGADMDILHDATRREASGG